MRTKLSTLALAGALLLGAAACGQATSTDEFGLETEPVPESQAQAEERAQMLAAAVEQTTDTSTGRFETTIEMGMPTGLPAGAEDLKMTMSGSFDLAAGRSMGTFGVSGMPDEMTLGMGGEVVVITDGTDVYTQMPGVGSVFGVSDDQWIKTPAVPTDGAESVFPGLGITGEGDPSTYLDFLRGASPDLAEVGVDDVRGVPTTHYRGTFTLQSAIDNAVSPEEAAALQETVGEIPDAAEVLGQPMAFDVYVDDEGLVRRVAIDLAMLEGGADESFSVVVTTDFFDLGEPVDIQIPSPDQVVDAASILENTPLAGLDEGWLHEGD